MHLGIVANIIEKLVLATGRVPVPIIEAFPTVLLARTIMAATQLDIFEALAGEALTGPAVAARCGTDPQATGKLLVALVGMHYLRRNGERFALARVARHWLLRDSPTSVRDYLLYNYAQWNWIARLEEYTRTGTPIRFHQEMTPEEWDLYQRGMRCIALLTAPEVARRVPVPQRAQTMLDIGGAHGYYAAAICRRHPGLRATILDLPAAMVIAAPLLAETGMGDRVIYQAGDALTTDLGEACYDLIFVANLVHHFDDVANRDLTRRIARALKPGGMFVIQDGICPAGRNITQFAALGDLYFALTSEAGLYSHAEMQDWQRDAGLVPLRPITLITAPGQGMQAARKPVGMG